MADYTWTGATSGTWDVTTNWLGGVIPVSNAANNVYLTGGSRSITVGPVSTPTFGSVVVGEGFGGTAQGVTLGTDSVSLVFGTVTTLTINNRRCSYMKFGGTAFTTVNVKALGSASLYFTSGAITTLYGGSEGRIEIEDNVSLLTLRRAGGSMLIRGDASSPVDLDMRIGRGAKVDCWRRIALGVIDGSLTVEYAAEGAISAGTSKVIVGSGGLMIHKATGDFAQIEVMPFGEFDGSKQPGQATKPTITSLYIEPNSKVTAPASLFTVTNTIANGAEFQGSV